MFVKILNEAGKNSVEVLQRLLLPAEHPQAQLQTDIIS